MNKKLKETNRRATKIWKRIGSPKTAYSMVKGSNKAKGSDNNSLYVEVTNRKLLTELNKEIRDDKVIELVINALTSFTEVFKLNGKWLGVYKHQGTMIRNKNSLKSIKLRMRNK